MNYVLTWNTRRIGTYKEQRYFIKCVNRPTDIQITSSTDIGSAKIFDSRQSANWMIEKIESHMNWLGIMDIIEMTDKELFEARLKGN